MRTRNGRAAHFLVAALSVVLVVNVAAPSAALAAAPGIAWTLGPSGSAEQSADVVLLATQLNNIGSDDAFGVRVESIRLDGAALLTPTLPVRLGRVKSEHSVVVEASFDGSSLVAGSRYRLDIRGSYRLRDGGDDRGRTDEDRDFSVSTEVVLPPVSPGSAPLTSVDVPAHRVSDAPFKHRRLGFDEEVNPPNWLVPTAPDVPGTPTAIATEAVPTATPTSTQAEAAPVVVFKANSGLGLTSGNTNGTASAVAEPSGASGGGVIFATANWTAAYSTDGGSTFTQLDPTTIFPNDAVGFCCDQVVQYLPRVDRFIWFIQGSNGYRLATARPADIISSGGTAWTYWNLTPQVFGQPAGTGFDYPDLSVGNSDLYMSWDAGFGCPTGCNQGFQVARTLSTGIQAGGTITIQFTTPSDSSVAWGSHLTQNTGDEIFWAGHNTNSSLRVFSLQEASNTYFWQSVGISSWANNAPTSTTPDGQDWLAKNFTSGAFPRNGVIGGTRISNQIWFAWSAGTNAAFPQAHVEMVTLDRNNNFSKIQQVQIWNPNYAFAYPALATNLCTGEVGLSFEFGGGGNYENHVVGFWGDFIAYITTGSDVGATRFGDYVTIRPAPVTSSDPGNLFTAFGYGLNKAAPPQTGTNTDVHYVLFGRPSSACTPIG